LTFLVTIRLSVTLPNGVSIYRFGFSSTLVPYNGGSKLVRRSATMYQYTRHHIPEDWKLYQDSCEKLKSRELVVKQGVASKSLH